MKLLPKAKKSDKRISRIDSFQLQCWIRGHHGCRLLENTQTAASDTSKLRMPVQGAIIRPYAKGSNEGIGISANAGSQVVAAYVHNIAPQDGTVIAGKSGTAQVVAQARDEDMDEDTAEHLRHHALFIAYAPFERPSIVVATVVEHGGGGSAEAAPVARAVLDA